MALPVTTAVSVAWSNARTGVITVGTSTVGGADVVGGLFSQYTFASITANTMEVTISRGRSLEDGRFEAGRCTCRLKDLTGVYNPENTGSALAPNVVPLRPLRIQRTHNSITYGLFFGWIMSIEHDPSPSVQQTTLEAVDFFYWLDARKPVLTLGPTTVGAAIGTLLDYCEFTDPAYRALDTGHRIPGLVADGTTSALGLIQNMLEADMGVFYVNGSGVVTYEDTSRRYAPGAVDDTLTTALVSGAKPRTDITRVRNGWTVTRLPNGVPRTGYDDTTRSASVYGPRDGDPVSSPYLWDDSEAEALANFKVQLYKDPLNPVRDVTLMNASDTLIVKQMTRDLGDRVALSESLGGTATTGFVEGLTHHVYGGDKFQETTLTISRRRFDFITVGTSTVGGPTVVGY